MKYGKTPFLTKEQGLQNKGVWTNFEWGSKEKKHSKAKWIEIRNVREMYPHLLDN